MGRGRIPVDSTAVGAALAALLGRRFGRARRVSLSRLRGSFRPGDGSLASFGGTPCSRLGPESGRREASSQPAPDPPEPPSQPPDVRGPTSS